MAPMVIGRGYHFTIGFLTPKWHLLAGLQNRILKGHYHRPGLKFSRDTYEGQNVALVLKSKFLLWFGSVSRFSSKLGQVF
eukprot:SAG11_NODE_24609_length_370_cov_13.992620_1_plen_79_part_10